MNNIYVARRPSDDVCWDEHSGFVVIATSTDHLHKLICEAKFPKACVDWHNRDAYSVECIGTSELEPRIVLIDFKAG